MMRARIPFIFVIFAASVTRIEKQLVNVILGIIYAVLEFGALIDIFIHTQKTYVHIIITTCSKIVATALISWYAWKWPQQEV